MKIQENSEKIRGPPVGPFFGIQDFKLCVCGGGGAKSTLAITQIQTRGIFLAPQ